MIQRSYSRADSVRLRSVYCATKMPRIVSIEIVEDRTAVSRCDEGFLRLKRYAARNRRADGSASPVYPIDVIDRPTLDAVAVCLYARTAGKVEVLTRLGLRPAIHFRRGKTSVLPEPEYLLFEEIVAGVLEPGERGIEPLKQRAAEEVLEEVGIRMETARFELLGAPFFMLPGIASEKIHLLAAEIPRSAIGEVANGVLVEAPQEGDGSPLEEGALLRWTELGQAIASCEQGDICDAKTELALRRLSARFS
jgi:ADP-ribose pyrophosphatase